MLKFPVSRFLTAPLPIQPYIFEVPFLLHRIDKEVKREKLDLEKELVDKLDKKVKLKGIERRIAPKNLELWEFFRHILASHRQLKLFEKDMQERSNSSFKIDSIKSGNTVKALRKAIDNLKKNKNWKSKIEIKWREWALKGLIQGDTDQQVAINELQRILNNLEKAKENKAILKFRISKSDT